MDSIALFTGLIGAVIGSLSSIGTLIIQNKFQNRRESTRLLFDTAFRDYELRINALPENRAAFPVILAYHQRMMALAEHGALTPAAAREVMLAQAEMSNAIREAAEDLARGNGSSPPATDRDD